MDRTQFDLIEKRMPADIAINFVDLMSNVTDRTLVYGYFSDRATFHLYLQGKEIHRLVTRAGEPPEIVSHDVYDGKVPLTDVVPDKRVYPKACDFEFCQLLLDVGVRMPFTTFDDRRPKADFYGPRYDTLGLPSPGL